MVQGSSWAPDSSRRDTAAPWVFITGDAMPHTVSQSAYQRLTERLNRFPPGAPPSEPLTRILMVLCFS
jgi:hypothetical protein